MSVLRLIAAFAGLCCIGLRSLPAAAQAGSSAQHRNILQADFAAAAREYQIPLDILLAVSYNESQWEDHDGQPSTWGGYGVMHLTDVPGATMDIARGKGDGIAVVHPATGANQTLLEAARLLHEQPALLKRSDRENIRGGAALLALYERRLMGRLPADSADWYGAVARYSQSPLKPVARSFADAVYASIRDGERLTTSSGQVVRLPAMAVRPNRRILSSMWAGSAGGTDQTGTPPAVTAECPATLACTFVAAAYKQNTANDPTDYGNYDLAQRPSDGMDVHYIVIHDTEGPYNAAINEFQNPTSYASAHYVVRSSDGAITQMVPTQDVAWHAGNWYVNMHSIGIENEGVAIQGATWYSEQLYQSTAALVAYLAGIYHVPLDRQHIVGHDNVPGPTPTTQTSQHWDPGPYWDWSHFMTLVGAATAPPPSAVKGPVAIHLNFAHNMPPVTYCDSTGCQTLPRQPSNFVYLRTGHQSDAPYIADPAFAGTSQEPNGAGSTQANDWGDKAVDGQVFYRFARKGQWDGIYYGGQRVWFRDPTGKKVVSATGTLVTPKAGLASIPVYGRAYPEETAYPKSVPAQTITPLQYTIPAGQIYVASDLVQSNYLYAPDFTTDVTQHTLVQGTTQYYVISFNHRFAYLKASDVDVVRGGTKKRER